MNGLITASLGTTFLFFIISSFYQGRDLYIYLIAMPVISLCLVSIGMYQRAKYNQKGIILGIILICLNVLLTVGSLALPLAALVGCSGQTGCSF